LFPAYRDPARRASAHDAIQVDHPILARIQEAVVLAVKLLQRGV
jgi:hypothetical protein